MLGRVVAAICNVFNPDTVVVGGDLGEAGDVLLDPMREAVGRYAIAPAAEDARIVAGVLGERAQVLGALALALCSPSISRRVWRRTRCQSNEEERP